MRSLPFDLAPVIAVSSAEPGTTEGPETGRDRICRGWHAVCERILDHRPGAVAVETYQGVDVDRILQELHAAAGSTESPPDIPQRRAGRLLNVAMKAAVLRRLSIVMNQHWNQNAHPWQAARESRRCRDARLTPSPADLGQPRTAGRYPATGRALREHFPIRLHLGCLPGLPIGKTVSRAELLQENSDPEQVASDQSRRSYGRGTSQESP